MNPYIEKLRNYLAERPINAHWENGESILDLLCYIYVEHNSIEDSTITYQFRELSQLLDRFTLEEHDRFSNLVSELCTQYCRQAFLTGVQVGYNLFTELEAENCRGDFHTPM